MPDVKDVLTCVGFNVWINIGNEKAVQYGAEYQDIQASCWIASTAGKTFTIQIGKENDGYDYAVEVYLDDHMVANEIFFKDETSQTISRVRVSSDQVRSFMFAPLDITDDDACLEQSHLKNIGVIKVIAIRGKDGGAAGPATEFSVPEIGKVHERSKKGLTHQVNYGPPTQLNAGRNHVFKECESPVTFLFKYRPLDMLLAIGIAPRTRSQPEGVKIKPEVIDLESDEEAADEAKERELMAELEAVRKRKRERQSNGRPEKKVKAEPARNFIHGEVIDLTL